MHLLQLGDPPDLQDLTYIGIFVGFFFKITFTFKYLFNISYLDLISDEYIYIMNFNDYDVWITIECQSPQVNKPLLLYYIVCFNNSINIVIK